MILVIDAYNVLKSVGAHGYIDEKDQERFIRVLGKYGKRKEHAIVAVFDGGHYIHTFRSVRHGVSVVYSGMKESADAYIKRYLKENKGRDILLISSDRELAYAASDLGIISMNAVEFYELLRTEMMPVRQRVHEAPAVKMTENDQPELDMLMYASASPRPKVEDREAEEKRQGGKSQSLSKVERAILKKIKKL